MRSSCNGCRVLRKGCSENCTIRPCLQWIKTPESQAQATLFLAKFYGRTGLLNLIHAGPDYLRPAVFKSLLYEACGRIVSPIYGSVGLLWSGEWAKCQAAVEAVLAGTPITVADDADAPHQRVPLNSCDIRHARESSNSADDRYSQSPKKSKFKRTSARHGSGAAARVGAGSRVDVADFARFLNPCHEHWSRSSRRRDVAGCVDPGESLFSDSAETEEPSMARPAERSRAEDVEVGLELTLGLA